MHKLFFIDEEFLKQSPNYKYQYGLEKYSMMDGYFYVAVYYGVNTYIIVTKHQDMEDIFYTDNKEIFEYVIACIRKSGYKEV